MMKEKNFLDRRNYCPKKKKFLLSTDRQTDKKSERTVSLPPNFIRAKPSILLVPITYHDHSDMYSQMATVLFGKIWE